MKNRNYYVELTPRKKEAIALFRASRSETQGKMIDSCLKAGYNPNVANRWYREILEIDTITNRDWLDLKNLLPELIKRIKVWLDEHPDNLETKDVREIWKGIRLIGDSVGKFIKREEKVTHTIDEKRAVVIYATSEAWRKSLLEKRAVIDSQLEQLDKESGLHNE